MKARTRLIFRGWLCAALLGLAASEIAVLVIELALRPAWDREFVKVLLAYLTCTAILVAMWAVQDAKRAYSHAVKLGRVTLTSDGQLVTSIAPDCPRRWLVILHVQLHPALLDL
jgi:hypothetical protein